MRLVVDAHRQSSNQTLLLILFVRIRGQHVGQIRKPCRIRAAMQEHEHQLQKRALASAVLAAERENPGLVAAVELEHDVSQHAKCWNFNFLDVHAQPLLPTTFMTHGYHTSSHGATTVQTLPHRYRSSCKLAALAANIPPSPFMPTCQTTHR